MMVYHGIAYCMQYILQYIIHTVYLFEFNYILFDYTIVYYDISYIYIYIYMMKNIIVNHYII